MTLPRFRSENSPLSAERNCRSNAKSQHRISAFRGWPLVRRVSVGRDAKGCAFFIGQLDGKNPSRGTRLEGCLKHGHHCTSLFWGNRVRLSAPQCFANPDIVVGLIRRRSRYLRLLSRCAFIKNAWIRVISEVGRAWHHSSNELLLLRIAFKLRPASERAM